MRTGGILRACTALLLVANAVWMAIQSLQATAETEHLVQGSAVALDLPTVATTSSTMMRSLKSHDVTSTNSSLTSPRTVSFLRPHDWTVPQKEAYSGMWWQATEHFVSSNWSNMISLETASFRAFGKNRARKTRDWLDLSVTHLSKYWKHFHRQHHQPDRIALDQIARNFETYLEQTQQQPLVILPGSPAPDTLAVIPYLAPSKDAPDALLSGLALQATIASLWQNGIGRCVVVVGGGSDPVEEEKLVREVIFQSLQEHVHVRFMQLQVVRVLEITDEERLNMPQVALSHLKQAMQGELSPDETQTWLGDAVSISNNDDDHHSSINHPWKFVYFTEPDILLHARPTALPAMRQGMQERAYTLSGHRFQPIPHQINFPNYQHLHNVIPNSYAPLTPPMNPLSEEHSCCDGGKYYPSNNPANNTEHISNNKACYGRGAYWWQCGFWHKKKDNDNPAVAHKLHHFLANYTLFRIQGGTDFPLVDHHQRICHFHKDGTNCAEGYPPDVELDKRPGRMRPPGLKQQAGSEAVTVQEPDVSSVTAR